MAVAFQFRRFRLASLVSEKSQRLVFTACMPPLGPFFIDHIDVPQGQALFSTVAGRIDAIDALVPIDVFLVDAQDLAASVNSTPAGAINRFGQAVNIVRLTLDGPRLVATTREPDLANLPVPGPAKLPAARLFRDTMAPLADGPLFDVSALFGALGLTAAGASQLTLTPDTVSAEFDAGAGLGGRLSAGEDWGVYIDGPAAVALAVSQVPEGLRTGNFGLEAQWAPVGTTPRVTAQASLDLNIAKAIAPVELRLSVIAGSTPRLRIDFAWDLEIDFSGIDLIDDIARDLIRDAAEGRIASLLIGQGAVRTGPRTFYRDITLPLPAFAGIKLTLTGAVASSDGMVLGGAAVFGLTDLQPFSFHVSPFGRASFFSNCRRHGEKAPRVRPGEVTYRAGVSFSRHGAFCGIILDPATSPAPTTPPIGPSQNAGSVGYEISAFEAMAATSPPRFTLRTARGVRAIDLGRPEALQVDRDGFVTNAVQPHLHNCLLYTPAKKAWEALFGSDDDGLTQEELDPPLERPGWRELVTSNFGLDAYLVDLVDLNPGEVVSFRSQSHKIHVIAGPDGKVRLPGFVPLAPLAAPGVLTRLNGESLDGRFTVRSAILGTVNQADAAVRQPQGGGLVSLNPQPLPPVDLPLVERAGLKDVAAVFALPGFGGAGIVVAVMRNGDKLLVENTGCGGARVSGVFEGPIGGVPIPAYPAPETSCAPNRPHPLPTGSTA